jgi:general secretion pathway protein J
VSFRLSGTARGFTLVEVMVSLTILSLIMLATISALRTFGNTQVAVERSALRVDEIRSVSSFLRDTLEAAVVSSSQGATLSVGPGSNIRPPPYFRGGAEFLEWKAPIMFGEAYGGVFIVRVAQEEDALVLRWLEPTGREKAEEPNWAESPSRVLLSDLDALQIFYRPEFGEPWQEQWGEDDSPALVRVSLRTGGRFWPDLVLWVQR